MQSSFNSFFSDTRNMLGSRKEIQLYLSIHLFLIHPTELLELSIPKLLFQFIRFWYSSMRAKSFLSLGVYFQFIRFWYDALLRKSKREGVSFQFIRFWYTPPTPRRLRFQRLTFNSFVSDTIRYPHPTEDSEHCFQFIRFWYKCITSSLEHQKQ